MVKRLFPIAVLSLILTLSGCENYTESSEINGLIKENDLSISFKVGEDSGGSLIVKQDEKGDYYVQINVNESFSLRGEAPIETGHTYTLSFVLKNTDADPVICYSFWKKPVTSLRHYTLNGENGNPPSSETQKQCDSWRTFEETFETQEGEDSFLLTMHSGEGTFYIKEIDIEEVK